MKQGSAPGRCRYLALCVVLPAFLLLSACGRGVGSSSTSQSSQATTPPTVTISSSATKVVAGGSLTLTVAASNATQVVISDNCDSSTYTLQATGGTQSVTVASTPGTCTYTATASGAGTAVATVPITVEPSTATVVSVTASALTITAGQSVTLTVTVANTDSVAITNNVTSTSIPVSAAGGTVKVTPSQTTTYTVTGTGANNQQATAQVTISVMSVSITASPATVVTGNSTTLTVTAANATQVVISDNVDTTTYTLAGTGGTQSVSPTATTIYTATATNGSVTATATVTVKVTTGNVTAINHVIFLMQENRTFDSYFGMLNQYRPNQKDSLGPWNIGDDGTEYDVDGIVGTASGAPVGNFPTSPGGVANPNANNFSDPVTCPTTGTLGTITCTPGAPVPATSFSLFKFATACVDDMTSDWVGSYGDVNTYDFQAGRPAKMWGFVHIAQNYLEACNNPTNPAQPYCGDGNLSHDLLGKRAMGYYDQGFLNYYYYMASQFALSDRWFSPVSDKTTLNRIATVSGGTTQGVVYDPFNDDDPILAKVGLPTNSQLNIPTIFGELTKAGVSWRIYYGITNSGCTETDGDCQKNALPSITFADFQESYQYLYAPNPTGTPCSATTTLVGPANDPTSYCIDTTHIVPVSQYFLDIASGVTCTPGQAGNCLPNFAYVEPAYGQDDEHPGSGQSILSGQTQVASMISGPNGLMNSPAWKDSVFFLTYDEGGGPFDHVPPVPNHSNDFTGPATGIGAGITIPDISSIAVNPDTNPAYFPCPANGPDGTGTVPTPTLHCDLQPHVGWDDPGYKTGDDPEVNGFAAQLGFRLPNMVISPFTRRHYVSHIPMDHTAIIKFVENRFIGPTAHLTNRDAAQPNLLDFFDFNNVPWATPPTINSNTTPPPTPLPASTPNTCEPGTLQ